MWTWWFIARDDEAPRMPDEEEGDRPVLSFEADEPEIAALAEAIGATYEPVLVFEIDAERSIVRVPDAFVRKLAQVDPASVVPMWQAKSDSIRARGVASLAATLAEMREFAAQAASGPGIVAYRET